MKRKLAILGAILLPAFIFTYEGNAYQAHAMDEEDLAWIAEAGQALRQIVEDREVMALVYLCDEYELRSDASEDSAAVVTVPSGQMVEILDVTVDEDGQGNYADIEQFPAWYQPALTALVEAVLEAAVDRTAEAALEAALTADRIVEAAPAVTAVPVAAEAPVVT